MHVILTEDIPKLGEAGELVRVRPGYGRNYLIPQGKALLATDGRVKQLEHQRRVIDEKVKKEISSYRESATGLEKVELQFEMQSNEEGKLFGSVTNADIHKQLIALGFELERRKIELVEPIKSIGVHDVNVRLHREVQVPLKVSVVSSDEPPPEVQEEPSAADQAMLEAETKAEEEEAD